MTYIYIYIWTYITDTCIRKKSQGVQQAITPINTIFIDLYIYINYKYADNVAVLSSVEAQLLDGYISQPFDTHM